MLADIIGVILLALIVIAFIYAMCLIAMIGVGFLFLILAASVSLFLCMFLAYLLVAPLNEFVPLSTLYFIFGDNYQIFSERVMLGFIFVSLVALFFIFKKYRWKYDYPYIVYSILSIIIMNIPTILFFITQSDGQSVFENDTTFFENDITNTIAMTLWNYIFWLNLWSFFFYTSDKVIAVLTNFLAEKFSFRISIPRVPEKILHLYTICGGTFGASIAMYFFRHKVTSEKFQPIYRQIFFSQIGFIVILLIINFQIFLSNN